MEISKGEYRELGKSGIMVSPISLGCWQYSRDSNFVSMDDRESIKIIRSSIEMGINFFDTAESYGKGHSEEVLGEAIRQSGKDVVIATKVREYNLAPQSMVSSVEMSLRRLKKDVIDLYQIHWPTAKLDMRLSMETLMDLKMQGKIRAIGVSNFNISEIKLLQEVGDITSLQSPYNLFWRCLEEVFAYCYSNNISVLSYSPLGHGLISGRFDRMNRQPKRPAQQDSYLFKEPYYDMALPVLDAVNEVAQRYGSTITQVAIAWLLGKKAVSSVVMGVSNQEQLGQNIGAVFLKLSQDDIQKLEQAGGMILNSINAQMSKSLWNWWPDKDE